MAGNRENLNERNERTTLSGREQTVLATDPESRRIQQENERLHQQQLDYLKGGKLWDVITKPNEVARGIREAGISQHDADKLKDPNRGALKPNGSLNATLLHKNDKRDAIVVSYKTMDGAKHELTIKTKDVVSGTELDKAKLNVDIKKIMLKVNNDFKKNETLAWRSSVDKVVKEGAENMPITKLSAKAQQYLKDNNWVSGGKMDFQTLGTGIKVVNGNLQLGNMTTMTDLPKYYAIGSFKEGAFAADLDKKVGTLANNYYKNQFNNGLADFRRKVGSVRGTLDSAALDLSAKVLDEQVAKARRLGVTLDQNKVNEYQEAKRLLEAVKKLNDNKKALNDKFDDIKGTLDSRFASRTEANKAEAELKKYALAFKNKTVKAPGYTKPYADVCKEANREQEYTTMANKYIKEAKNQGIIEA